MTLDELFHYITINRIVSRLQGPTHKLTSYYGLAPGGPNVDDVGGEKFGWDLFDRTRNIATGRFRMTGPATAAPQKVGTVNATCYRMFEQTPIDGDRIFRKRGIGQPLGALDVRGERYLTKQIGHIGERFMNARELMVAWMFRGGFKLTQNGDSITPVPLTGTGEVTIDYQHPAGNRGDVGGIFAAGNWDTPGTANIIQDLLLLNEHSMQNSRYAQQTAWVRAQTAAYILQNDEVASIGGTANMVTADGSGRLSFTGDQVPEGGLSNLMGFTLRGYPDMKWWIYDDTVVLPDGTVEPYLKEGQVLFTPAPSSGWLEWKNGSELVQKEVTGPMTEEFGFTMWQETQRNPVGISLYALDNGLPAPYVPDAWYLADVYTP